MTPVVGLGFVRLRSSEEQSVPVSEGDVHELFGPILRSVLELHDALGTIEELFVQVVADRELTVEKLERGPWAAYPPLTPLPIPHPEPDAELPDYDTARDSERGK